MKPYKVDWDIRFSFSSNEAAYLDSNFSLRKKDIYSAIKNEEIKSEIMKIEKAIKLERISWIVLISLFILSIPLLPLAAIDILAKGFIAFPIAIILLFFPISMVIFPNYGSNINYDIIFKFINEKITSSEKEIFVPVKDSAKVWLAFRNPKIVKKDVLRIVAKTVLNLSSTNKIEEKSKDGNIVNVIKTKKWLTTLDIVLISSTNNSYEYSRLSIIKTFKTKSIILWSFLISFSMPSIAIGALATSLDLKILAAFLGFLSIAILILFIVVLVRRFNIDYSWYIEESEKAKIVLEKMIDKEMFKKLNVSKEKKLFKKRFTSPKEFVDLIRCANFINKQNNMIVFEQEKHYKQTRIETLDTSKNKIKDNEDWFKK